MKKILPILLAVLVAGAVGAYMIFQNSSSSQTTNEPVATGTPNPTSGTTTYKDGSYTGSVSPASQYGDVQVKAIISGGKITDVQFLQFPNRPGHTQEVTDMAEPILKQETITAQSANIDIVSGATQDTQAFIESLQSALDQAKG